MSAHFSEPLDEIIEFIYLLPSDCLVLSIHLDNRKGIPTL